MNPSFVTYKINQFRLPILWKISWMLIMLPWIEFALDTVIHIDECSLLMVPWVYGGELECCIPIWGSDGKYIKFSLCMMFRSRERFFQSNLFCILCRPHYLFNKAPIVTCIAYHRCILTVSLIIVDLFISLTDSWID